MVVDAIDECEQPLQLTIAAYQDRRKIGLLLIGARSLRFHTPSLRGQAAPPSRLCDAVPPGLQAPLIRRRVRKRLWQPRLRPVASVIEDQGRDESHADQRDDHAS